MRALLQALSLAAVLAVSGSAQCLSAPSESTISGVTYHLWIPVTSTGQPCGNGDLVIYAHGYVTPSLPAAAWLDELTIGGVFLPTTLNQAGYAVAASDYSKTGLAILEGKQDTLALANAARTGAIPALTTPVHTFLIGASEAVPIADTGTGIFKAEDGAIQFMRWIRKHLAARTEWERERQEQARNLAQS